MALCISSPEFQRLLLTACAGNTPGRPNMWSGEQDFCFIARLETRPERYLKLQLREQRGFFTLEEGLLHLQVGRGSTAEVKEPYVGWLESLRNRAWALAALKASKTKKQALIHRSGFPAHVPSHSECPSSSVDTQSLPWQGLEPLHCLRSALSDPQSCL